MEHAGALMDNPGPVDLGRPLNPADGFFAYRLLLCRNPDPQREIPYLLNSGKTLREFLKHVTQSAEFQRTGGYFPPHQLLMAEVEGFRFWFNSSDREMGVRMALGQYEPRSTELIKKLVRPGMKCIDLGAQTGFYTCLLAKLVGKKGKVYAFEPMHANYELLQKNVAENDFGSCVQAIPKAASARAGTIEGSLISSMFVAGTIPGGEKFSVESARVDQMVSGPIDFVKIDVEGHEPSALEGMKPILQKYQPIILSEVNEYWLRSCSRANGKDYVQQLLNLGYEAFKVDGSGKLIGGGPWSLESLEAIDVLALPKGWLQKSPAAAGLQGLFR
jgi:FkbM family methyltransferase